MSMNRFELVQMRDGLKESLMKETDKFEAMLVDTKVNMQARTDQENRVKDYENRLDQINMKLEKLDHDEAAKAKKGEVTTPQAKLVEDKAKAIRAVLNGEGYSAEMMQAVGGGYKGYQMGLLDDKDATGGGHLITDKTNEIIHEPFSENEIRDCIAVTNERNLELPKITFTIDGDASVVDGETAKELEMTGDSVSFGRNKVKIKAKVSETVLLGSSRNLVKIVDNALQSGLAVNEVNRLYAQKTDSNYKAEYAGMSFYAKNTEDEYLIKKVSGTTRFKAIMKAIADLPSQYRKKATIVMRYMDYLDMIFELANNSRDLFNVDPEKVLGYKVKFEDNAVIPIVGDLSQVHINYDPETIADRDKDVDSGMHLFVLTGWYDIKFKLRSAFRLVDVTPAP